MNQQSLIPLTATEVGSLWTQYINDTMAKYELMHFLHTVNDEEIKTVLEFAFNSAIKQLDIITEIFNREGIPIPAAFSDRDVNLNAPALYLDTFYLRFLQNMARIALASYGLSAAIVTREDIRIFYNSCLQSSIDLNGRAIHLALAKGIYVRAPYIPVGQPVTFAKTPSFAGSIFRQTRPLNALSIMSVFPNAKTAALGHALLLGFSQVATMPEIRDYLLRGSKISASHYEITAAALRESDLPAPGTWESEVTASTTAPFSDKLMMQHVMILVGAGIADFGAGMGVETRIDIGIDYAKMLAEVAAYGEDGLQLMIKNGWLEQPPQAVDRSELIMDRQL